MRPVVPFPRVALTVAALCLAPAHAATVHTWVDADGVRHFSDAPPTGGENAQQIQIEDAPQRPAGDDYYSIVNQWNRTRAEKDATTAQQLERERIEAPAPTLPEPAPAEPARGVIYPGFGPYGYGVPPYGEPPGRGHRHRRDLDDEQPPVAPPPPAATTPAGNPHSVNTPAPLLPSQR